MRLSTKEADVLRGCLDLLAACRVLHWRSNNTGVYDPARKRFRAFSGRKGVADIIAVLPTVMRTIPDYPVVLTKRIGRVLAMECKSATGKQSPEQQQFQADVEAAGGLYVLARCVKDLEDVLRREGVLA